MNKTLITLLAAMGTATAANADTFLDLGFDTADVGYTLSDSSGSSISQFSDRTGSSSSGQDYFSHSSILNGWHPSVVYNGAEGGYFAGQDINGEGASEPLYLTTSAFDISNATDLQFAVDLAEDDSGSESWDESDFVDFEYTIDGGATWNKIFGVEWDEDDRSNAGDIFNENPEVNDVEVTDTFAEFSAAITDMIGNAVTGTTMQIRVVWDIAQGGEDLAIDNLTITGNRLNVVPLPSAAWAGLGLLGAMGVGRRLRK